MKNVLKIKILLPAMALLAVSVYIGFNLSHKEAIADSNTDATEVVVYKSPTCGCCTKWVSHLEKNGFKVNAKNMQNMNPVKQQMGVQPQYQSCHTAKIGKYFIEGHVPAKDIKRLLKEQPDIKGLSAPGMPMGSPGMEGPRKDRYDVVAIDKNNRATVYSSY